MAQRKDALRHLAATQDGQFATKQALAAGISRSALSRLALSGEVVATRRGVWRFAATPGPPDQAVTAYLVCWPAAVISHRSAGVRHGLVRVGAPRWPELTVLHPEKHKLPRIVVHQTRVLDSVDVQRAGGVRYTAFARTVIDLATHHDVWETLALVDDAIACGLDRRLLHKRATVLARGRDGAGIVRRATDPRAAAEFRSWLERAGSAIFRAARLPNPEWNVEVRDERGVIGIVDALWRHWRVITEMEGLRFHTTPSARRRDAHRFNRFADAGYGTRRFTWEDVVFRPVEVAVTIQRALRAAGADLDPLDIPRAITVPAHPYALA